MSGLDEKGLEAARAAFYGPKGSVVAAISAYLAAATPAYVGELVERLRELSSAPVTGSVGDYLDATDRAMSEAAAALERVTRERDEAHLRTAYLEEEVVRTRDAAVERVRTAEAKLAEARKVIERYESGLNTLATTFYKDDQHQEYAKHVLDIRNLEPRHD